MEILYFNRNENSEHIHSYSSASCFYIPSEKVVLYAEENGTFGSTTFSISTYQPLLNDAQILWENKQPTSTASFSGIKHLQYDDKTILDLIKDAKEQKSLEERVKTNMQSLLDLANPQPKPIDNIDPATLNESTKQHLEDILQLVTNEDQAKQVITNIRPEKKEELQQEIYHKRLKNDFNEFTEGKLRLSDLSSYMNTAHKEGLLDIAQQYAKIILQEQKILGSQRSILRWTYRPKEYYHNVSLTEKLEAATYLNKPEPYIKKLHEQLFYATLIDRYYESNRASNQEFLTDLEEHSKFMSKKEQNNAALKAYGNLMWHYKEYDQPNYLQAARIAKIYLSENEFIAAGKKVVENFQVVLGGDRNRIMGKEILDMGLPDNLVRPLMGKIFSSLLRYNREYAEKIEPLRTTLRLGP